MSGYTVKPPTGDTNEQTQFIDYFNLFYSKRGQEQISISQQLGNYGTTFFSASRQSYWNTSRSDQQISFGLNVENQTGIHTDWRGYAILPFATEYRENRVALNANSLADNVELDETVVTVIPTHGAIARATFNAQIGGKVLMTLKYGNKSVPFGAIVTHGENKNGSIVAENGQVYLTGLPQSGQLQVSWGKDKNSNCIVEYKLPEVSPGTLLNQQTAICR
ncbi:hypothetical protein BED09_06940 [Escherichia coli]|nr:hypothetical protein [Escherichia coli]